MATIDISTPRPEQTDSGTNRFAGKTRITIGRSPECDLSFPGIRAVSRHHAEILYRDGSWYLKDTDSQNGTWLNKKRLAPNEEYLLHPGDEIDFAHAHVMIFMDKDNSISKPIHKTPEPSVNNGQATQFCRSCGGIISGRFCPRCGALADIPQPAKANRMSAPMEDLCSVSLACADECRETSSIPTVVLRSVTPASAAPAHPVHPTPMAASRPVPPAPMSAPPAPMPQPSMAPRPNMAPRPSMAPQPAPMPAPAAKKSQPKPAPKKPGLLSKVGALFGGKAAPAAPKAPVAPNTPAAPAPVTPDDVQFRGTAPKSITPGEYFPVKIMMYREDDYDRADRESAAVADQVKSASSSVFQARKGQKFRITLQSPDIELDSETQQLSWNGKFAAADFEAFLPKDYDRSQVRIRGRVYSGDAVLTDLKLILQVQAPQAQAVPCEKVLLRSAFISYASADRAKVVARIQGIQLACPDMDLFFDVESLRRGESWENRLYQEIERRDLFYLFWSQNAAASEWVKKELQYAVSQKTVDFIEPIPLEEPAICPPPASLTGKHFNDWTLRYLSNQ